MLFLNILPSSVSSLFEDLSTMRRVCAQIKAELCRSCEKITARLHGTKIHMFLPKELTSEGNHARYWTAVKQVLDDECKSPRWSLVLYSHVLRRRCHSLMAEPSKVVWYHNCHNIKGIDAPHWKKTCFFSNTSNQVVRTSGVLLFFPTERAILPIPRCPHRRWSDSATTEGWAFLDVEGRKGPLLFRCI